MPESLEKRVDIKVGLSRPRTVRSDKPRVCIVGIATPDMPWLSDLFPDNRIRVTRLQAGGSEAVEQVRFSSQGEQGPLPHIASRYPSRIRDAYRLLLAAGAPEVDMLMVRSGDAKPWDLDRPELSEMLAPFLSEMPNAVLVYPDAGGPWPNNRSGLVSTWDRLVRLQRAVRNFSTGWADHYQLGVMDMVPGTPQENRQILLGVAGADVALCQWSGTYEAMQRHGWRPACAALGGYLAGRPEQITQDIVGHNIPLGPGRYVVNSRAEDLGRPAMPPLDQVVADTCVVLELHPALDVSEVASSLTFRRPLGEWSISAVRTVKMIHQQLVRAADLFVFRPAQEIEATALGVSVEMALQPFYTQGIIVGPDGAGAPFVKAGVERNPSEPGLYVDLAAQIRPWCQQVAVRVMIKSGAQPQITEI